MAGLYIKMQKQIFFDTFHCFIDINMDVNVLSVSQGGDQLHLALRKDILMMFIILYHKVKKLVKKGLIRLIII